MPLFTYKAQKPSGEIYTAKRSATDKFALYHDIKREGDTVISTTEKKERAFLKFFTLANFFQKVSLREKIMFARNLGAMLEAGLSLSRSLSVMERQTRKKGLRETIQKISTSITQGKSLSDALREYPEVFNTLFVSMVKAGEESGSLPASLTAIASQMMSTYTLQKKIKGAMMYPAIIVVVIIAISILMLVYVVPNITAVFKDLNVELPWNTKLIISLSTAFTHHVILLLSLFVGTIVALSMARKSETGKKIIDYILLHLPVIKTIVKESNSARTARTLSSLLSSGVEVVQSLEITGDVVQNSYFKSVLSQAKERIKKGEQMSAVFSQHTRLYPIFVGEMISIGEETGKLGEMLSNVADYYEAEVDEKTKDLSVIIEPVLMIIVGCAVGFFAISMLAPTYSLVNQI